MAVFVEFADVFVIFFFETLKNVLKRGYYREFATTLKHVVCVELLAADQEDEERWRSSTPDSDNQ